MAPWETQSGDRFPLLTELADGLDGLVPAAAAAALALLALVVSTLVEALKNNSLAFGQSSLMC